MTKVKPELASTEIACIVGDEEEEEAKQEQTQAEKNEKEQEGEELRGK